MLCYAQTSVDEDTGLETLVVSLNGGAKKRVMMNTHALQQKTQVTYIYVHIYIHACVIFYLVVSNLIQLYS